MLHNWIMIYLEIVLVLLENAVVSDYRGWENSVFNKHPLPIRDTSFHIIVLFFTCGSRSAIGKSFLQPTSLDALNLTKFN